MESRYHCLKPDPNGGTEGYDTASSGVVKKYGWYHTLSGVVAATPMTSEDMIYEWPVKRFLKRLQYLSDVWQAEKHDAEITKLRNSVTR